ncbi:hypothetical protein WN51_13378 [Melipona quadrifasciata]|uniref:Uncharacterized protein n=1 Tax=Melipona quadrifasciata TaxID=166423 RepID=A0A0N1ITM7_9HYME|nr:hypothetical protein WN51_13378 [Melipona quadrifasciata]
MFFFNVYKIKAQKHRVDRKIPIKCTSLIHQIQKLQNLTTSVDFLQTARNTVAELNSRGDSLARERRRFVTYQAEPHEVSTATGFSWQSEDGHADWPGDLAGNGAGKDETGSGADAAATGTETAASLLTTLGGAARSEKTLRFQASLRAEWSQNNLPFIGDIRSYSNPGNRGWNPVKRYPNGTVTGTCPVVRGPDDEPEIGSQGSECGATGHRCESGSETTQFSSTFDLCSQDIKDRFFATNGKEMLPPPVSTDELKSGLLVKFVSINLREMNVHVLVKHTVFRRDSEKFCSAKLRSDIIGKTRIASFMVLFKEIEVSTKFRKHLHLDKSDGLLDIKHEIFFTTRNSIEEQIRILYRLLELI